MIGHTGEIPCRYDGLAGLSWLSRAELEWLAQRLAPASRFVEVGTASGVSAAHLADLRSDLDIVCVDSYPDHDAQHVVDNEPCRIDNWRRNQRSNMALWVGTLESLAREFTFARRATAYLIDAGHEAHEVAADIHTLSRLARLGDRAYFHDYGNQWHPGVTAAVLAELDRNLWQPGDRFGYLAEFLRF